MRSKKPMASLSLDLDNQWSYMKTHGDPGWESYPSYLDIVVPRVLNFLAERDLNITFFIVGQDAALDENSQALQAIAAAGHEIGNHSFKHEQWLHLYSEQEIEDDLSKAERHIERVTGQRPIGFRGPGFSCSESVLRVLARRGYVYDASTFPTYIGPLARAYYFMTANLSPQEAEERKKLFGTLKDGLRPLNPYWWQMDSLNIENRLLEIPVTTMPIIKVPLHASYILYLSIYSEAVAMAYFRAALTMCRLAGVQLSLLLHPLDFLGCDDTDALAFFPAMGVPSAKKVRIMEKIISLLSKQYDVLTMQQHARKIDVTQLPKLKPHFGANHLSKPMRTS